MMNADNQRDTRSSDATSLMSPIPNRYLLVINIPLYADSSGHFFADPLWFKDLKAHLRYLCNFTIACPVIETKIPKDSVALDDIPNSEMKVVRLPVARNLAQALALLPFTLARLWGAIAKAELVHSGVAGWPFPLGWLSTPLARFLGKRTLIIVESAPWRLQPGLPISIRARIKASLYEIMAKWCIRLTDLAIFTQEDYRRGLACQRIDFGHVIHASWIDESNILPYSAAENSWKHKLTQAASREIRFLFAGRLETEKGVLVLLDAITLIAKKNIALRVDILGTGTLASRCEALHKELNGATRIELLGTVTYGAPLFELLRQYHALIVPSISDEQPRIVYDAYSQAVPVIATRTPGLRDCITHDETGWLVQPSDAVALADALERGLKRQDYLHLMGMHCLKAAAAMTHEAMHRKRQHLLLKLLQE